MLIPFFLSWTEEGDHLRKHASERLHLLVFASGSIFEIELGVPICGLVLLHTARCTITGGEILEARADSEAFDGVGVSVSVKLAEELKGCSRARFGDIPLEP